MAISPPSDIVLDVVNAVGRTELKAARAELRARASSGPAASFPRDAAGPVRAASPRPEPRAGKTEDNVFVKFEAMVLETFIETMLPDNANAVYGEGFAGDMWKSMMAREIAGTMARKGGVGIADHLLKDYYMAGEDKVAVSGVGPAKPESEARQMLSVALVQEIQRNLMQSLGEAAPVAAERKS